MSFHLPDKNLLKRAATGTAVGVVSFASLTYGGLALFIYIFFIMIIGALEFAKILKCKGFYPFKSVALIFSILILFLAFIKEYDIIPFVVTMGAMISFLAVIFRGRQPYIANVATTALMFLYCGLLPAHIIMIRQLGSNPSQFMFFEPNNGLIYLYMFFFGVLLTDVGAYYFGKKFGKRKLAPIISPNKTVEGALGGILSTLIVCGAIGLYTKMPLVHIIFLSLVISIFAQLGDLSESLIKRDAGVKDSGDSLPGHGGILDRTDGYLFSAPAVYYYVYFFILNNYIFIDMGKKLLNVFGL